eukprot:930243-Amphidinium_carterae.1
MLTRKGEDGLTLPTMTMRTMPSAAIPRRAPEAQRVGLVIALIPIAQMMIASVDSKSHTVHADFCRPQFGGLPKASFFVRCKLEQ